MSEKYRLISPKIKANCLAAISLLEDNSGYVVTIKTENESRSDAQHRLRWVWMTYLEKELAGEGKGRDKEQWNLFFKNMFMPTTLIAQDEDYAEIFGDYKETCRILKSFDSKRLELYQKQFWDRVISTKDMNVRSMTQWLNNVNNYAQFELHKLLPVPSDLQYLIKEQ